MKLPAKVDYASRAVLELSLRYKAKAPVQIGYIADSQRIPKNFLLQLLIRLKNAGIVNSSRGVAGGYFLAKEPKDITLADVFRAVDDSIVDDSKKNVRSDQNIIDYYWNGINVEVIQRLEAITFEEMAFRTNSAHLTYYI